MRLLLFSLSAFFAFIFYSFYLLGLGRVPFSDVPIQAIEFSPLSGNLIIESIIFLIIGILFVISFTPLSEGKTSLNKQLLVSGVLYIFAIFSLYFDFFYTDKLITVLLIFAIIGDLLFNYVSGIKSLKTKKIEIRYFALFINYIVSTICVIYMFFSGIYFYLILISVYSIFFNYGIYKEYKNYISLLIMGILSLVLFYFLILKLYNLYVIFMMFIFLQ